MESIEQTFSGSVAFGKKVTSTISRNGDLITQVWLECTLKKSGATYYPAEALLKDCEIEIGGQKIDKHYSAWYRIYDELHRSGDEKAAYRRLVDFVDGEASGTVKRFYVPLVFWFNRNPGLALPLIALQYHEVKVSISFATAAEIGGVNSDTLTATLYADYIYLDTDERRRFAQTAHEYLIEVVQFTGDEAVTVGTTRRSQNVRLSLNHPVKYLAWVVSDGAHGKFNGKGAGESADAYAPLYSAKLQLNGQDRFSERRGSYFSQVQPFQHWGTKPAAGVYTYSFALKPADHQPSGSCNFSRIDNATLQLTFKAASSSSSVDDVTEITSEEDTVYGAGALTSLKVFAVNYNVLRVMSGINSPVPNSWMPPVFLDLRGWENIVRSRLAYNQLVPHDTVQHMRYAGSPLERSLPPRKRKLGAGTRVMTGSNGQNENDWVIRRQWPTGAPQRAPMATLQRAAACGCATFCRVLKVCSNPLAERRGIYDQGRSCLKVYSNARAEK